MNSTATKIAAGTSLLGVGGVAGALLAPQQESGRAAFPARAQATVVRTVYIKRVHRRVIREKPKPVHHASVAAAPAAVPAQVAVAPSAPAASAPLRTRTSATHAPAQQPLRTRTSGSHGKTQTPLRTRTSGGGEHEHEHGDD